MDRGMCTGSVVLPEEGCLFHLVWKGERLCGDTGMSIEARGLEVLPS